MALLTDNIVDADDAVTVQNIVDMTGDFSHAFGQFITDAGRCDFLYLTVVFGIIVEELVFGHHLRRREEHGFLLRFVASHRDFGAFQIALHHHHVALHHCLTDGWSQLVFVFHLRHTKAAAIGGRLYKAGHTNALFYLVVAHQLLIAFADEQALSHAHPIAAQILIEHKLVEGHCFHQYATC